MTKCHREHEGKKIWWFSVFCARQLLKVWFSNSLFPKGVWLILNKNTWIFSWCLVWHQIRFSLIFEILAQLSLRDNREFNLNSALAGLWKSIRNCFWRRYPLSHFHGFKLEPTSKFSCFLYFWSLVNPWETRRIHYFVFILATPWPCTSVIHGRVLMFSPLADSCFHDTRVHEYKSKFNV